MSIEKFMDVTFSNGAKIGVSDTLDKYTSNDLKEYLYCASYSKKYSGYEQYAPNGKSPFLKDDWSTVRDEKTPFTYESLSLNPYDSNKVRAYNVASGEMENVTDFKWITVIYFYKNDNTFAMPIALDSNNTNLNKIRVVTNFDADKICNNLNRLDTSHYIPFGNNSIPTSWEDNKHPFMSYAQYYIYNTKADMLAATNGVLIGLYPYAVIEKEGKIYLFDYYNFITNRMSVVNWNKQSTETYDFWFIGWDYNITQRLGYIYPCEVDKRFYWFAPRNEGYTHTEQSQTSLDNWLTYYSNGQDWDYAFEQYLAPSTIDEWNEYNSVCGLYFRTDKLYKPIISQNCVVDYTDDLSTPSEIDSYTYEKGNKHEVPKEPPSPTPEGDYSDNILIGGALLKEGNVRYYAMTESQLENLFEWMSSEKISAGENPFEFIRSISVQPYRDPQDREFYANVTKISFGKFSYEGSSVAFRLTAPNNYVNLNEPYTIKRRNEDFSDYAPYCKVKVYIPFCGEIDLPVDIIMGREIQVRFIFDIPRGNCRGLVFCNINGNWCLIGGIEGVYTYEIPMSVEAVGQRRAAELTSRLNIAKSIASTAGAVIAMKPYHIAHSAVSVIAEDANRAFAENANYIENVGVNGNALSFEMPKQAYISIDRVVESIPDNFARTHGFMCNKGGKVKDFTGYSKFNAVHVAVEATNAEKDEITRLLERGVILPDTPRN